MRLFTGFDIPSDVIANLEELLRSLKPTAAVGWSPPSNLHITTKFIGEIPESRLPELKRSLAGVPVSGPITISVARLGFFPNPHRPRVFWAGVQAPSSLKELAAATDRALTPLGIQPEDREFSPHLTLARIKDAQVPLQPLREAIAALPSLDFGSFTADRFYLYLSKPGPKGSVYSKLAEYPLTR